MEFDYITTYFQTKDFSVWRTKATFLKNKLSRLKTERGKGPYKIELFTEYLQLTEIFLINFFAITEKQLFPNLFLNTHKMDEKIRMVFFRNRCPNSFGNALVCYDQKKAHKFLLDFVFLMEDMDQRDGAFKYLTPYDETLRYSLIDYLLHKDCLNSYKHGFRFTATGEAKWTYRISFSDEEKELVTERIFNSYVIFLKKIDGAYFQKVLGFDWKTIFFRILLLVNMLQNMKLGFTEPSKFKVKKLELPEVYQNLLFTPTQVIVQELKMD